MAAVARWQRPTARGEAGEAPQESDGVQVEVEGAAGLAGGGRGRA